RRALRYPGDGPRGRDRRDRHRPGARRPLCRALGHQHVVGRPGAAPREGGVTSGVVRSARALSRSMRHLMAYMTGPLSTLLLHRHVRPAPERPPIVRGAASHKAGDPGTGRLLYRVVCPDLGMYAFPDGLCDVLLVLTKRPRSSVIIGKRTANARRKTS